MSARILNSALLVTTILVSSVAGQFRGWLDGQANTTICFWSQPRAALVRDTVYLDGGSIYWTPGMESGEYGRATIGTGNPAGYILSYNLSEPFSPGTNVTGILVKEKETLIKARGGSETATNAGPNFEDGAMLANDYDFFLYGGVSVQLDALYTQPPANWVLSYEKYVQNSDRSAWSPGFKDRELPENMTRYVAYGGAASAPSENKAWYFSGLRSPTSGPIYQFPSSKSTNATEVSDYLITLDMKSQLTPVWTKTAIGDTKGRANPEVVWVPVGEQGILVVLGGVVHPTWTKPPGSSSDGDARAKENPEFMQDIDIYDVASKKWYKQETSEGPGARTRGCAVVAPASDYSSFNIYYYGGYNGIDVESNYHDDVWVLSLPSFTWTRLNEGRSIHARVGHKCFTPYPNQMMVFGGSPALTGHNPPCLDSPVVLFNLSSGDWMDSYDPTKYGEYSVPSKVANAIGGDAAGHATKTAPASGWQTSALGEIFEKPYDRRKLKTYYPYSVATSAPPRPEFNPNDGESKGKSGLPSWLPPVLGVVIGLVLLTAAIVLFCLWRRRKILKSRTSEHGTEDAGMRILSWVRGQTSQPIEVKAPTVTTSEEMPASHEFSQQRSMTVSPAAPTVYSGYSRYEMGDTQVMELDDTSPPAELHNTGFTHLGINRQHPNNATPARSRSLSKPSSISGDDFNDNVSQTSGPVSGNAPAETAFVDSPTLAMNSPGGTETTTRCTSDVSMITNRASHLRNLSDATVSSEGTHIESRVAPERMSQPGVQPIPEGGEVQPGRNSDEPKTEVSSEFDGPVSPPTADEVNGDDYLAARPLVSPIAKTYQGDEDAAGQNNGSRFHGTA